ncbi:MAG: hypothetical protein U0903_08710 [Planctomycetales bacterium]
MGFVLLISMATCQLANDLFAEPPQRPANNKKTTFSAKIVRGPEAAMQEFVKTLPLSPIERMGRGFPFQQAVLSQEQVTAAVNWTEKHKSVSLVTIPEVTFSEEKQAEIEFLKGRIAEIPVPQTGIRQVSVQQMSEGIKVRLNSSRAGNQSYLKCEWESTEFVSLKKVAVPDQNGKKTVRNLPGPMKTARFQTENTVPDGRVLAVSKIHLNSGAKKPEVPSSCWSLCRSRDIKALVSCSGFP